MKTKCTNWISVSAITSSSAAPETLSRRWCRLSKRNEPGRKRKSPCRIPARHADRKRCAPKARRPGDVSMSPAPRRSWNGFTISRRKTQWISRGLAAKWRFSYLKTISCMIPRTFTRLPKNNCSRSISWLTSARRIYSMPSPSRKNGNCPTFWSHSGYSASVKPPRD